MRLVSVWVLLGAAAFAGQKTVITTAGDCADPGLISGAKDFRDATKKLLGADVLEPDSVLDIVRPRPTRSVQDLERQVDSARTLFYGGQNERSLELIERALSELERAEPDAKPWKVTENALVLQALVLKNLERTREMNEAFRRIVRINPAIKLDPEAHAPSTIAALEAVKKEVARVRKVTLSVRVESGPAGSVAIDGQVMGTTPLKVDLIPGVYRVSLINGAALSFPHRVELPRDAKLAVDLAFEGAVSRQLPLCLAGVDDGAAIKLAQLVGAERLIVLRNMAKGGAPTYVSGALYDVATARQERTGSVAPDLMANLATFLVTGREVAGVRRPDVAVTAVNPPPPSDLPSAPVEEKAPPQVVEPPKEVPVARESSPPPAAPSREAPRGNGGRIAGGVLIGLGVAAIVTSVPVFFLDVEGNNGRAQGLSPEARLAQLAPNQVLPDPETPAGQEALLLYRHINDRNVVGATLLVSGAAFAVGGLLAVLLFPPSAPVVSLAPTRDGASLSLSGSF